MAGSIEGSSAPYTLETTGIHTWRYTTPHTWGYPERLPQTFWGTPPNTSGGPVSQTSTWHILGSSAWHIVGSTAPNSLGSSSPHSWGFPVGRFGQNCAPLRGIYLLTQFSFFYDGEKKSAVKLIKKNMGLFSALGEIFHMGDRWTTHKGIHSPIHLEVLLPTVTGVLWNWPPGLHCPAHLALHRLSILRGHRNKQREGGLAKVWYGQPLARGLFKRINLLAKGLAPL